MNLKNLCKKWHRGSRSAMFLYCQGEQVPLEKIKEEAEELFRGASANYLDLQKLLKDVKRIKNLCEVLEQAGSQSAL